MLKKILLKIKIELKFLLIHKWGVLKSGDLTEIPKFEIKKYLGKNPIIVDCGAHVGADSIEWLKLLPKATVHSFEPVPTIFESLKSAGMELNEVQKAKLKLIEQQKDELVRQAMSLMNS